MSAYRVRTLTAAEQRGSDVSDLHLALDGSYADAPLQVDAEP